MGKNLTIIERKALEKKTDFQQKAPRYFPQPPTGNCFNE